MSAHDAAVTGMGLLSPAGLDLAANWKSLCQGVSLAAPDPVLAGLRTDFSCAVPDFMPESLLGRPLARRLDTFLQMALVAARQAVDDSGLDLSAVPPERVAVVLGVGSNSLQGYAEPFHLLGQDRSRLISPLHIVRSVPSMAAAEVALDLGARGPNLTVSSACASGTSAIGTAMDLLRAGRCDVALAGGAESARSRMTAACFSQMRALSGRRTAPAAASRPFDADRDGFVLGEGAAVLVLERGPDAHRRRARVYGRLAGYGASADAHHPFAPEPSGRGAEAAIRAALADAGRTAADIDHINAHGTSTPAGDAAEAAMLRRVFAAAPPVTANKSVIGHALGASGAIEAVFTLLALHHRTVPPTANVRRQEAGLELDLVVGRPRPGKFTTALSTSSGFGGQNAALVMHAD